MIKQFVRKQVSLHASWWRSHVLQRGHNYEDKTWWDTAFYRAGVSDAQTIRPDQNEITARYHYNSVELLILQYLHRERISLEGASVVDLGSGSGHWIDFYRSLGAERVVGIDVSSRSTDFLRRKYADTPGVEIHHGRSADVLRELDGPFDLANAVGVMFHIVDDDDWADTIQAVGRCVGPDGRYVVGGHFGMLDGLNVQIDAQGRINKRLRSRARWTRELREAGFPRVATLANRAYLHVDELLPENNLLVGARSSTTQG